MINSNNIKLILFLFMPTIFKIVIINRQFPSDYFITGV